jgi:hypothetical protein
LNFLIDIWVIKLLRNFLFSSFLIQRSIRRRRTSACSPVASWTFDVHLLT